MTDLPAFAAPAPPAPELIDAVRALALISRVVSPGAAGLSHADHRVMSAIAGGEARATRLASRLALGKSTISTTVESLSKRGLVLRSEVEGDSRATELSLSPEGAELLEQAESRMARQLDLLCERTPDGPQVIRSLGWLGAVIEQAFGDRIERETRLADPA